MALKLTNLQLVAMALAGHFLGGAVPVVGSFPQEQSDGKDNSPQIYKHHPLWTEEETQQIGKLDPSLSKWMMSQSKRLETSPEYPDIKKETIKAFENIPLENQPLFSAFLKEQKLMSFEWAKQLALVSPQDWATTLEDLYNELGDFINANATISYPWIEQLAHVPSKEWVITLKDLKNEFSTFLRDNQVTNPEWIGLLSHIAPQDWKRSLTYYQCVDFLEKNDVKSLWWAEQLIEVPAKDWPAALQNLQKSGTLTGESADN